MFRIQFNWNKLDLLFYFLLIFLIFILLPYGDNSFDTLNYHLYNQERPFADKIYNDFFAGRSINTFSLLFGDRFFYLFRYFLNYRVGKIANYLLVIVLFYNIKIFIKKIYKINENIVCILTCCVISSICIIEQINTYYVDLLSTVLLFILLNQSLNDDNFYYNNIFIIFLSAISICVKISNAYYALFFCLIYIIKNKKQIRSIKFKNYLIYLFVFLFPSFIYMFYNYKQTGNPVFPYYNALFKSKLYLQYNWVDTNYGPKIIIEFIVWPIIMLLNKSRACDSGFIDPMWAISYLVLVVSIFILKQFKNKKIIYLNIFALFLYFIWIKNLLGYCRYGIITYIIGYLTFIINFMYFIDNLNHKRLFKIIFSTFIIINIVYVSINFISKDNIRNVFNSNEDYINNIKLLFESNQNYIDFPENSAWIVMFHNSGEELLINNSLPLINITDVVYTNENKKILENNLNKYDHFYVSVKYEEFIYFLHFLELYDWDIVKYYQDIYLNYDDKLNYIFEIKISDKYIYNEEVKSYITREINVVNYNNVSLDLLYSFSTSENGLMVTYYKDDKIIKLEKYKTTNAFLHLDLEVKKYDKIKIEIISFKNNSCDSNSAYFFNILKD